MRDGLLPIDGLRHPGEVDTTGWSIRAGEELSTDHDFFVPVCVSHLGDGCPDVIRFLGLPAAFRFLVAGEHEDVWEDRSLLDG